MAGPTTSCPICRSQKMCRCAGRPPEQEVLARQLDEARNLIVNALLTIQWQCEQKRVDRKKLTDLVSRIVRAAPGLGVDLESWRNLKSAPD